MQTFRIAIELQSWIRLCNFNPRLKIERIEKISALMYANQFGIASAKVLNSDANLICSIVYTLLQIVHNSLQILCATIKCAIVLHLATSSEATKLSPRTILDGTLAIVEDCPRFALISTGTSLPSGKIEDQGLLA